MSQHDFDIANQTAASARSDLNLALKALASTSAGALAPVTAYAGQLWYDTTNDILKIRNEANSAWINLGFVDQVAGAFSPNFNPATYTDVVTATDNTKGMTPLRTAQYVENKLNMFGSAPFYAARAWARYNGTTGNLIGNVNISSVVKNSTGNYTFNFASPMPDIVYSWQITTGVFTNSAVNSETTSSITVLVQNSAGVAVDVNNVNLVIFR